MVDQVVFEKEVAPGSRFGAGGWLTDVIESRAGTEQRAKRRPYPRRRYELEYNARDKTEVQEIQAFIDDREGRLKGFLIRDWSNYQLTDEVILTATGGESTAQIKQTWGVSNQLSRTIRYIDQTDTTLVVKKDGTPMTLTSEYTIDTLGLITFVIPLSAAEVITVTCDFYVPVRFDIDEFFVTPSAALAAHSTIQSIPIIEVLE